MPLVEVEDTQLAELKNKLETATGWQSAWSQVLADPELKEQGWELFKKKFPNVAVPELDAIKAGRKPVVDEIEKIRKEFQEYREAQEKEKAENAERTRETVAKTTIASSRRKLKSAGWDDEGIEKVEALMQERGIGDYDVAAAYVKSQLPQPAPLASAYEGRDLNWFNPGEDAPDHKMLMDNPNKFKSDMIKKFFSDKAAGNLQAWAA